MFSGYPDGTIKPENMITRAEAATLVATKENRTLKPIGTQNFTDVPADHWAYSYIMNASIAQ
jgi:hypothetical protein